MGNTHILQISFQEKCLAIIKSTLHCVCVCCVCVRAWRVYVCIYACANFVHTHMCVYAKVDKQVSNSGAM